MRAWDEHFNAEYDNRFGVKPKVADCNCSCKCKAPPRVKPSSVWHIASAVRRVPRAEALFADPFGLALLSDGTLLVSDKYLHAVFAIDAVTGLVSLLAGVPGESSAERAGKSSAADAKASASPAGSPLSEPAHLALSSDDSTLFVADAGNSVVRRLRLARVAAPVEIDPDG